MTLRTCQHDGVCINLPGYFRCECPDQFTGDLCENFRLITCANQPCKNDGVCTDVVNPQTADNFTCTCATGYEGSTCDDPYCIGKCQNAGRCEFSHQVRMVFTLSFCAQTYSFFQNKCFLHVSSLIYYIRSFKYFPDGRLNFTVI